MPTIQDDFYLNLVDWSCTNILGVGLGSSVYLWNASTCQNTKLVEFEETSLVSSVCWIERGKSIAIGGQRGLIEIWDVEAQKKVRELSGHRQRVGSLSWNDESGNQVLASGSRDHSVFCHDLRADNDVSQKLVGHRQEVCGLRWSPDGRWLASGGNDNKLFIWDCLMTTSNNNNNSVSTNSELSAHGILCKFSDHCAAVKAIAWSPHQRGILASGGGTADRSIRIWNVLNSSNLSHMDTGSQVCNLAWSKNVNEVVSTHGYSQNQVVVWSCQNQASLFPVATLLGHTTRVLYLSMSPDGDSIVTGAGDETLRFWNIFPSQSLDLPAITQLNSSKLTVENIR